MFKIRNITTFVFISIFLAMSFVASAKKVSTESDYWEIAVVGEGFSDLRVQAGNIRPCNSKNTPHCIANVSSNASVSINHTGSSSQCYFASFKVLCGKRAGCFKSYDGLSDFCEATNISGSIVFGFSEFYEPTNAPVCGESASYPLIDCSNRNWECNPTSYASINCKPCRFCGSQGSCLSTHIEQLCKG